MQISVDRWCRLTANLKHQTLHKKWSFPLRISSVNVTKSAVSIFCAVILGFQLAQFSVTVQWQVKKRLSRFMQHLSKRFHDKSLPSNYLWNRQTYVVYIHNIVLTCYVLRQGFHLSTSDNNFEHLQNLNDYQSHILSNNIYCHNVSNLVHSSQYLRKV